MWDLVVIGGGSAGLVASRTAAGFGASVLLVENDRLGGDCLWTGCVPSKALLSVAADAAASGAGSSRPQDPGTDPRATPFARARTSVQRAIAEIEPVDSRQALEADRVAVMTGSARFTAPGSVDVDGVEVAFRQALIATGSSPVTPQFPGSAGVRIRTSADFWDLTAAPERLVVLGGGPVGCELGQAMARLGSQVTIVQSGARLLPKEEPAAAGIVAEALTADGVTVLTGRRPASIRDGHGEAGVLVLDDGTELGFDAILAATGRAPGTTSLDLDRAGVRADAAGYVRVDATLRTANPRVWAAGDVTGLPKYTHTAGMNGAVAATNAILGLRRKAETAVVPRVTFTAPEVAAVGLQAADADPRAHRVVTQEHRHADRAIAAGDERGYTRIVVDRRGRVLGGTIVSPRAGETVGELALAVKAGLTTTVLASTIHPYPTFSDPLWNAAIDDMRHRLGRGAGGRGIRALRSLRSRRMGRAPG